MKIRSVLTVMTLALCGAPLALALGASPAGATPTPISGTCTGGIAMPVPSVRLVSAGYADGVTIFERSERMGTPSVLAPGTYQVTAGSKDRAHPDVATQANEQWYAVFLSAAGAEAGRTEATPDLADDAVSATWTLGDLTLTAPATAVQYVHVAVTGAATADSVEPACLVLTAPPVTTTSTTSTTSTTTTTLAPTTSTTLAVTSTTLGATPPAFPVTTTTVPVAPAPTVPAPAPTVAAVTLTSPTTVAAVLSVPVTAGPEVLGTAVERPLAITGAPNAMLTLAAALMIGMGLLFVAGATNVLRSGRRRS